MYILIFVHTCILSQCTHAVVYINIHKFSLYGCAITTAHNYVLNPNPNSVVSSGCGNTTYTGSNGNITSPNYPNEYGNNVDCYNVIIATQPSHFHLRYLDINMQLSEPCSLDYVEVINSFAWVFLKIESNLVYAGDHLCIGLHFFRLQFMLRWSLK